MNFSTQRMARPASGENLGAALAVLFTASGCTAVLGADARENDNRPEVTLAGEGTGPEDGEGDSISPHDGDGNGGLAPCVPGPLDNMPTKLLTRSQMANMLSRVFPGVDVSAIDNVPPDDHSGGFIVGTSVVGDLRLAALFEVARGVGEQVSAHLGDFMPTCDDASDPACIREFLDHFGRLVFRRTLTEEESAEFLALHAETGGNAAGLNTVLQALLLSGEALYHVEPTVNDTQPIVGTEMATKLSLLLSDDTPNKELIDAAEAGELDTEVGVRTWATRLLEAEPAAAAIGRFYEQWIGFEERAEDPALTASAANELRTFTESLTRDPEATFADLYTSPRAFLDQTMATTYGVAGDFSTPHWTELDPKERAGLLTRAAFLLDTGPQTSPTVRGQRVRERLLCQHLPAVPGDIEFPPFQEELTPREFVEYHLSEPSCAGCHELLDPIGLGFEQYSEEATFRAEYAIRPGEPIDPSGEVGEYPNAATDVDGTFSDLLDLSTTMGRSVSARECFTEKWYRFTLGRSLTASDTCELEKVDEAFSENGAVPRSVLFDLVTSPGFRMREATK